MRDWWVQRTDRGRILLACAAVCSLAAMFGWAADNHRTSYEDYRPYRVGAVCIDGTESDATNKGACSRHSGVDYWLVERLQSNGPIVLRSEIPTWAAYGSAADMFAPYWVLWGVVAVGLLWWGAVDRAEVAPRP
jgi:hypothetical protein